MFSTLSAYNNTNQPFLPLNLFKSATEKKFFNSTILSEFFPPPPPPGDFGGKLSNWWDMPSIEIVFIKSPLMFDFNSLYQRISDIFSSAFSTSSHLKTNHETQSLPEFLSKQLHPSAIREIHIELYPMCIQDALLAAAMGNVTLLDQCRALGIDLNAEAPIPIAPRTQSGSALRQLWHSLQDNVLLSHNQIRRDLIRPIHMAALEGHLDAFRFLVEQGVDVEAKTLGQNLFTEIVSRRIEQVNFVGPIIGTFGGLIGLPTTGMNVAGATAGPISRALRGARPRNLTCAHLAARNAHINILEELYSTGKIELLKEKDYEGRTIAHFSSIEVLKWIASKFELAHLIYQEDNYKRLPLSGLEKSELL